MIQPGALRHGYRFMEYRKDMLELEEHYMMPTGSFLRFIVWAWNTKRTPVKPVKINQLGKISLPLTWVCDYSEAHAFGNLEGINNERIDTCHT